MLYIFTFNYSDELSLSPKRRLFFSFFFQFFCFLDSLLSLPNHLLFSLKRTNQGASFAPVLVSMALMKVYYTFFLSENSRYFLGQFYALFPNERFKDRRRDTVPEGVTFVWLFVKVVLNQGDIFRAVCLDFYQAYKQH